MGFVLKYDHSGDSAIVTRNLGQGCGPAGVCGPALPSCACLWQTLPINVALPLSWPQNPQCGAMDGHQVTGVGYLLYLA